MKFSNSYLITLCFGFLIFIFAPSTSQALIFIFCASSHALLPQIASELSQVLTSSSSHDDMDLLHSNLSL